MNLFPAITKEQKAMIEAFLVRARASVLYEIKDGRRVPLQLVIRQCMEYAGHGDPCDIKPNRYTVRKIIVSMADEILNKKEV